MSNLYWLTDEQMARLQPFFPKSHGRSRVDAALVRCAEGLWAAQDALQPVEAVG